MSVCTPYRRQVTSAKRHGYYRVPEELKSLLVDLTIFLLHHENADKQQVYTLSADFLEERLHERKIKSETQTNDGKKNANSSSGDSLPEQNLTPDNNNLKTKLSEFADHESKDIISSAISDYLTTSTDSSKQKDDVSCCPGISGIHTDALGNVNLANVYEYIDHPSTVEEIGRCRSAEGHSKRTSFNGDKQDGENRNVYEKLEHPITLSELQVIGAKSQTNVSGSTLSHDYSEMYQSYADKCSNELMKLIYEDVVLKLGLASA